MYTYVHICIYIYIYIHSYVCIIFHWLYCRKCLHSRAMCMSGEWRQERECMWLWENNGALLTCIHKYSGLGVHLMSYLCIVYQIDLYTQQSVFGDIKTLSRFINTQASEHRSWGIYVLCIVLYIHLYAYAYIFGDTNIFLRYTACPIWIHISNSLFKAQSWYVFFHWNEGKETHELLLWAFNRAFEKVFSNGLGWAFEKVTSHGTGWHTRNLWTFHDSFDITRLCWYL